MDKVSKITLHGETRPTVDVTAREEISAHIEARDNPHDVSAEQIGLGNVNNTADMDKPISTAQQAAIDAVASDTETARQIANRIYEGVDLEALHAGEISAAPFNGDVWAWIQARIRAGDYRGINVGDFISFQTIGENAQTVVAEMAGINTYARLRTFAGVNRHIDFISRDCFSETIQWNLANYNNGLPSDNNVLSAPWMASNVRAWLNGLQADVPNSMTANPETVNVDYTTTGVFPRLPAALRAVLSHKSTRLPTRFSDGILLTEDVADTMLGVGLLWLPSEIEVFGRSVMTTRGQTTRGQEQYPIFANSITNRTKGLGHNGEPTSWWLASVQSGNSVGAIAISPEGFNTGFLTIATFVVPVCFRIA